VKKPTITIVIFISTLVIAVFLFLINDIVISIRLNDLKVHLQELDQNEGSIDQFALVATYEMHKKMFEDSITQENADELEHKIKILSLRTGNNRDISLNKYKYLSIPALYIINFNRQIIGKIPLKYREYDNSYLNDLDTAYYYERNYLFKEAISQYDKVLGDTNLNSTLTASILLRQGYCYALADIYTKAENNYKKVIERYSQESSAITAVILLRYLDGFKLAREKVLSGDSDPLVISQKLVNLLAYKQALNVINDIERTAKPKDLPKIRYYKARCYTGLGKLSEALKTYSQVIADSPDSQYAKYSNRKLFLMGTSASRDNNIIAKSRELNMKFKDPVLNRMIKEHNDRPEMKYTEQYPDDKSIPDALIPDDLKQKEESLENGAGRSEKAMIDVIKSWQRSNVSSRTDMEKKEPNKKVIHMEIITSDGNTFKGILIEENESFVALQTSIGRINVKREKITQILKNQ
jgi:tetratricopeptide (TPR) repeat protein